MEHGRPITPPRLQRWIVNGEQRGLPAGRSAPDLGGAVGHALNKRELQLREKYVIPHTPTVHRALTTPFISVDGPGKTYRGKRIDTEGPEGSYPTIQHLWRQGKLPDTSKGDIEDQLRQAHQHGRHTFRASDRSDYLH